MKTVNYASAKLLIAGEYLVLKGAKALAVPLKRGMALEVEDTDGGAEPVMVWEAWVLEHLWFSAVLSLPDLEVTGSSDMTIASGLRDMLLGVRYYNPNVFKPGTRYQVVTRSDFDHSWGFGSSSALLANLARWAGIDPIALFFKVSSGSGYDVATAIAPGPVLYWLDHGVPHSEPVEFNPSFRRNLWFVYLGQKQDTRTGIANFLSSAFVSPKDTEAMDALTKAFINASDLDDFMRTMQTHESFLSGMLKLKRIRQSQFNDFIGEVKSLGTWGGDFAMVASPMPEDYIRTYFGMRGLTTVFGFDELIRTEA